MKKRIRMIATLVVLALAIIAVSPATLAAGKAAKKIRLNKKKISLVKGKTLKLKVKGTKKKVTWKSSKKKVAAVNKKGKVTAKKKGTATITAKVARKKLKCKVTVINSKKKNKKITPKPSKVPKPSPTLNPGAIAANTKNLKEYILKNGIENEDGNPEIITEVVEGTISKIAYQKKSDSFLFGCHADLSENEEEPLIVDISMAVDATRRNTANVAMEITDESDEDVYYCGTTTIDVSSYTESKNYTWKVEELTSSYYGDESLEEFARGLPALSDMALYLGFVSWETHLTEDVGLSMKALGFVSFTME